MRSTDIIRGQFGHLAGARPAATPPAPSPARRAADDGDDDDSHRERDEELRAAEDAGGETDETPEEKKARHAREARRAKKAADDDSDNDDQDEKDPRARAARAREKGRIRAIMTSRAAKRFPVLAAHVALETTMTRKVAVRFVGELGPMLHDDRHASPQTLADQIIHAAAVARGERPGRPSAVGPVTGHVATASQIVAAGRKARGES